MAPDIPSRFGHGHNFPTPTPDLIPTSEKCMLDTERRLKCVLLGDGAVGKTSLIVSYTTNGYPTDYLPTAFDNYSARVNVDDHPIRLQMCDTAGQDDFDKMRPLCYPGTDVVLLCFSVVRPTSLCNVRDKWLPEIRKHMPKVPLILVGTQIDLRSSVDVLVDLARSSERPVTEDEAEAFAEQCGAVGYVECSALTQKNLKQVFDTAIMEAMDFREHIEKKRKKSWKVKRSTSQNKEQTHKFSKYNQKSSAKWKKLFCFA